MYSLHEYFALKQCEQTLREIENRKPQAYLLREDAPVKPKHRHRRKLRLRVFHIFLKLEYGRIR